MAEPLWPPTRGATWDYALDDDGATVVSIEGEIDLIDGLDLEDWLAYLVGHTSGALIVDLTKVTFIGSVGFRALYLAQRAAASRRFLLRGVSPSVARVLEVAYPGIFAVELRRTTSAPPRRPADPSFD